MKYIVFHSVLTCIFLVLGSSPTIHAQTLSGRVYEGNFPSEPPAAQWLADVTVTLYGSNNSGQRGTYITSTTTGSDGWYGLEAEVGFEFYTIVSGGKAGYSFQGSSSVAGSESGEEIEYTVPLAGKTLTGNKFWYTSDTPQPPVNNPPVADAGGPYSTQLHEPVQLDGSGSYDPDTGDSITGYQWYWFYQGNYIPINGVQTTPTIWWVPPVVGQSTLQLEVTDSHGESDTDTATVDVQEEEPPAGTGALGGYKRDAETEAGLENWRIFIDFNGNGQWDEGEPYGMTDSTGYYQITDIEPGTYRVCEEMQPGWQGDHPCVEGVAILEGVITVQDFHNRRTQPPQDTGSIRGSKYNDLNGNGQRDPGEPGLADWQITLQDDDGTVIAIAITGANGNYEFGNVEPGTYNIDEIQRSGWRKTDPEVDGQPALWSIGLEPDGIVDGVDFGNIRDDSPSGQDYEEEHGDAPEPYFDFYLSVSSSVFLGSSVDGEPAMQRDPHALGDDNNDGSDDEDGVEFVTSLIPGQQATIRIDLTNTTGASFGVSGHIDFDQNGNWDTGESVIQHALTAGIVNTLTFTVPARAQSGVTFARFFIVDQGPEPPWGIPGGEVEDYEVVIGGEEPDPDSHVDVFGMCLYAEIDIVGIGLIKANLHGPVTQRLIVGTYGAAADSDADGLDDVSIELADLNLTANDPIVGNVKMTLTAGRQTTGRIEEQVNNNPGQLEVSPQTANAFIDLFFDIELPDLGFCFRAGQAIRVQGALSHAPPASPNIYSANLAIPVSLYKGPCGMAWPVNTSDPPDAILHTLTACDSGVPDGRYDFGDAPDSYGTLQGSGGPYHDIGQVLMGNLVDAETDGKPRMLADGDDNDISADEDGVSFPLDLQVDRFATVLVNATAPTGVPLAVAGWIDYDQSGTFEDPQERYVVINYTGAGAGVPVPLTETIKVPSDAKTGWTYTRFRIYRTEIGVDVLPSPAGPGGEGEVEDYRVEIKPRDDTPGDPDGGSVTIVKKATPADDTRFSFCANFAPGGFFNVLCQDLQDPADPQWILSDPSLLEKVTETVPVGWTLRNIVVSGDTDLGSTVDLSKRSVDVDYDPGENIVLVFENERITSGGLDFGDAPASYGSASNDVGGLRLGASIDGESGPLYSAAANGDDLDNVSDEDGVTLTTALVPGQTASLSIRLSTASGLPDAHSAAWVAVWIDYNRNGQFQHPAEVVTPHSVVSVTGPQDVFRIYSFDVPATAQTGTTFMRVRTALSPGPPPSATGHAGEGEVEDYQVEISETGGPGVPGGVGDFVWNDMNRNGIQEAGEPGIPNVWVDIYDQSGTPWMGTATDVSGKYTILNLPPGNYYLDFTPPAGYVFTGMAQGGDPTIDSDADPAGRTNIFVVSGGLLNQDIDAGMYRSDGAGEIRGVKWNDLNGNGVRDAGEPGLANWRIILDLNQDGVLDSSPLTQDWIVSTNANGEYSFVYYFVGSYIVGEELQSGWRQTFPNSISGSSIGNVAPFVHSVTLSPNQTATNIDFGNIREGVVDARDYGDAPSSYGIASHDVGGLRLGTLIDGEGSALVSATADGDDVDNVADEDGVTVIGDLVPGQNTGLQISLTFPSQMPTKGVAAWVDFDGNGAFQDPAERIALIGGNVIGGAQFAGISSAFAVPASAKTGTTFMRVRVGPVPGSSLSPTGHGGQGEVEDYQVTIKADGQILPPGEIFGGYKFNDLNGNGRRDAGEPGLANWTMWIDLNGNGAKDSGEETLTNPDGSFFFTALSPGTYTIHEEMQSGWVQTHPGGSGIHTVTVQAGQATASVAFGNRRTGSGGSFPGTVHGYKWNDLNANGIYDIGEEWLAGWTFWLDTNRNGRQDSGDRQTQTDATGHFRFANVPVGTYTLGEELQPGWVQTTPGGAGTYSVTVQSGQGTFPMMFGNRQTAGGTGQELDWGDAPDPSYPTLEDSGGASHTIVDGFHLGASIDPEPNGRPSTDARGDDMQGIYDEDGVFFLTPLMPGQPAMVEIVASAEGLLDAWIDFDADGDWSQAHDRIFTSRAIQSGSNVLEFQVPRGMILDVGTYSRFRFSSGGALDPDGPAADGEVEDYHIVLGPEGPGVPGEFDVPHAKWSQPPIEIDPSSEQPPVFCGYGELAMSTEQLGQRRQWRMVVDDFRCLGPISVTRIRWWGSYEAWVSPEPPEMQPIAWHIGFWANMVEGLQGDELYPERLIWGLEVPPERINLDFAGLNEFPDRPAATCFFHELALEPEEWFHQAEFGSNENIFWISITAIYPPEVDQVNMWGWSTRPHVWGRGAMMPAIVGEWPDHEERLFPGRIYPVENARLCGENQAYDLCFELLTEQPWNMWDQTFVPLREWPHCEDQESYAVEDEDGNMQIQRRVADDWFCERADPVIAVSWHGSYVGYGYEACKCDQMDRPRRPDYFILSLRTIADEPAEGIISSELVWEYRAYDYGEVLVGYDCNPEDEPNEAVFQYSVRLPEDAWFSGLVEQEYWLGIVAVYGARLDEIEQPWGWTNRPYMYGSPAHSVSFTNDGPSREPLFDRAGEPVDMSFSLFTVPVSPANVGRIHYSRSTDARANFEPGGMIGGASAGGARVNPGIAVDDQEIIHVVWEDYAMHPSLGNIMYANSSDGGRSFGGSVMVDDPVTVSTHQGRPQIALDDDGNIHVVWEDYRRDPRLGDIYYSKSTDGGRTFEDDVLVDDPITVTSRQAKPAMVVDSSGGIHIVWEDYRDNAEMANIYYAASTDGGQTFGADKRLNEVFDHATHHGRPTIVADTSDTLYAFWEDYRNASHLGDIYCSVSADGGATFGSSVMVDDPITVSSRQIRPAAAVDGNGIVYVVWEDYRDDAVRGNIYSARSLDGGRSFKKDVMVDSPFTTSTHQANPALAVTESGLVRVVWEDYRVLSEPANIYYSVSLDNGKTFSEDQPVGGPASATGPRLNPAIAVDAKGVVHLVYQQ